MSEHSVVERPQLLAFDSTQTLRAIDPSEIADRNQQKRFVVELALSDQPVNLEAMPRLDVFAAHRLYAVEGRQGSRTRYSLRLGFFIDEHSAQTICGYVRTFFRSPTVVRVSTAEWERFETRAHPKKPSHTAAPVRARSGESPAPSADGRSVHQGGKSADVKSANVKSAAETAAIIPVATMTVSRSTPQMMSITPVRPAQPRRIAGYPQEPAKRKKSLAQELLDEARQIELSKSGRNRNPKQTTSWISRLLGRS